MARRYSFCLNQDILPLTLFNSLETGLQYHGIRLCVLIMCLGRLRLSDAIQAWEQLSITLLYLIWISLRFVSIMIILSWKVSFLLLLSLICLLLVI